MPSPSVSVTTGLATLDAPGVGAVLNWTYIGRTVGQAPPLGCPVRLEAELHLVDRHFVHGEKANGFSGSAQFKINVAGALGGAAVGVEFLPRISSRFL